MRCILQAVQLAQIRHLVKDLVKLGLAISGILLPLLGVVLLAYSLINGFRISADSLYGAAWLSDARFSDGISADSSVFQTWIRYY